MASLSVQAHLNTLCQAVKDTTKRGGFLHSTAQVSRYWIVTNDLNTDRVITSVAEITVACLQNLQREEKLAAVFALKQHTRTTEDHFPWSAIIDRLRRRMSPTRQGPKYYDLDVDREQKEVEKVVHIPPGAPAGTWLGLFSISAHVDLITSSVDGLRSQGRTVKNILVVIERDKFTRQHLEERGVRLVPFIVCDERTGDPKSILDMKQLPYSDYHKYFAAGES